MAIRVTCTSCGAAYKIDENKIPPTGGAIKCQNCGTRFAVMRPTTAEKPTPSVEPGSEPAPLPPKPPEKPPEAIALPPKEEATAIALPPAEPPPVSFSEAETVIAKVPPKPPAPPVAIALPPAEPPPSFPVQPLNVPIALPAQPVSTAIALPPATPAPQPVIPLPQPNAASMFEMPTNPGFKAPLPKPASQSIPLPSVSDIMSDDTPITLTDDDDVLLDEPDRTMVGPLPSAPPGSLPLDLPDLASPSPPAAEAIDRADAFDDLPVPSGDSFDREATSIGPLPDMSSLPAPLSSVPHEPTDLPEAVARRPDEPEDLPEAVERDATHVGPIPSLGESDDGVPEPLEASMPAPLEGSSSLDAPMPEPIDLPEERVASDLGPRTPQPAQSQAEPSDPSLPTFKDPRRRVLLWAGVLTLMLVGALATSYFLTGGMPWQVFLEQPKPQAASQPVLPPIPPLPDFAAIEGRDLDAYRKALGVLEERKAARKARQQPQTTKEDDAVRAKLLWQAAVLLGSKALGAELEKDPAVTQPPKEGDEPHPNIERAQAALALLGGNGQQMDQILDRLLARDKGDNDALLIRGYAKLLANDTIGASKAFDDVLKINAKNIDALLGHAEVARRAQDRDGAASYLEQAESAAGGESASAPTSGGAGNARVRLMRAELQLEDSDGRKDAKKMIEALTRNPQALGERDRARLFFASAKLAAQGALSRIAVDDLQRAASEDPSAPVLRALVWQQLYADKYDEAGATLTQAAKAQLDSGESFFLSKVLMLYRQGFGERLVELAKAGTQLGIEKRTTLYATGLGLEAERKLPAAMKVLAVATKLDKTFSWPVLADIRLRPGKPKQKLIRYALVAKAAGDAPSQAAFADALFDDGQFAKAADRYEQALDKDPWVLDLRHISENYAAALQKSGRGSEAARILIANQRVDPRNTKAVLEVVAIAKSAGALDEAQRLVEKGLEEHPTEVALRLARAEVLILRDNRDKARSILQQLLKEDEKNAYVHEMMAKSYHPQEPDLVKLHIKNAINLNGNEPRFWMLLGDSYFSKNRYDEAYDAYERARELDPKSAEAVTALARVCELQGKKKEAIDRMREALKLDPTRKHLVLELGERLEDMGQKTDALQLYQETLKRDPGRSDLLVRIGYVYQQSGNQALAQKTYLAALKLKPDDAQVHYRLAYMYKDAGQNGKAIKAFESYLKLNPKADDAREIQAEIQDLKH